MKHEFAHLLRNLIVFDVASRSINFTRAAEDLNLSRVAVSRLIGDLEAELGRKLFSRNHRRIELTRAGQALVSEVTPALNGISNALKNQRQNVSRLSVTVTSAFATYWLMPNLVEFGSQHPEVEVNLVVADRYLDLNAEGIDIAVRYTPSSLGSSWKPLTQEMIFPVFSPNYKPRTKLSGAASFQHERLLHLSGIYRAQARWANWFQVQGLTAPREQLGIHVNTYVNMLQAAIEGQGVALAGHPMVNRFLEDGSLIRVSSIEPLKREYFYVHNSSSKPEALAFEQWLFGKFEQSNLLPKNCGI